jgi:hypothetical protein
MEEEKDRALLHRFPFKMQSLGQVVHKNIRTSHCALWTLLFVAYLFHRMSGLVIAIQG